MQKSLSDHMRWSFRRFNKTIFHKIEMETYFAFDETLSWLCGGCNQNPMPYILGLGENPV